MNEGHLQHLASPEWRHYLEAELLPWVIGSIDLGDDVLEIGPGPGLTTDVLRQRVGTLTAVESDAEMSSALAARLRESDVEVVHADAAHSGLASDRFSAVASFSMLHHVPTATQQDEVFAEVYRVLRSGGTFVGVDAMDVPHIRDGHAGDTFLPLDPATLSARLNAAGFSDVHVEPSPDNVRFYARKHSGVFRR